MNKNPLPEQYRTLADLVEKHGDDWCSATAFYKGLLIVATPGQPVVIRPDGSWEYIKFITDFAT